MELYSIRLTNRPSNRCYVNWCNERWYSTDGDPSPHFTDSMADSIIENLKNHYCYRVQKIDSNGNVVKTINHITKRKGMIKGKNLYLLNSKVLRRT